MQSSVDESSEMVCDEDSNGHYTVIVTDTTDGSEPDEFVLDLASLPTESDCVFDTPRDCLEDGFCETDNFVKGTKRTFDIYDLSEVKICDETGSSGYESDSEHGEDRTQESKRKKVKYSRHRAKRSTSKNLESGEKRKYFENNRHKRRKRLKRTHPIENDIISNSSSSSDSDSSSTSSTSSDSSDSSSSNSESSSDSSSPVAESSSDSDMDILYREIPYQYINTSGRLIPCADSCACKARKSKPPIPIERSRKIIQPLYKKLLQHLSLSVANTYEHTCCYRKCYVDWERRRIPPSRLVRDYGESNLRVDYFSWGEWKQKPEVDNENLFDAYCFW